MLIKLGAWILAFRIAIIIIKHVTALKNISFFILLVIWLLATIKERGKIFRNDKMAAIIIVFVLWAITASVINKAFDIRRLFNDLIEISLFYFFTVSFLREKGVKQLIMPLGVFPIIILIFILIFNSLPHPIKYFVPFSACKNIVGSYFNLTYPFSLLALKLPLLSIIYTLALLYFLFTIKAKASLATVSLIFLLWALYKSWKKTLAVFTIVLIALALNPRVRKFIKTGFLENRTLTYRITNIWPVAIEMIKEKPVFGWGYSKHTYRDNYQEFIKRTPPNTPRLSFIPHHAHNNFLAVAIMTGLPGLLIFLAIIVYFFKITLPRAMNPEIFTILLSFSGEFLLCGMVESHFIRLGELFFLLIALPKTIETEKKPINQ